MDKTPKIIEETPDFAVVFKPSKMHSAAKNFIHNREGAESDSTAVLFDWYAEYSPPVFDIMHRLDYETNGLVLFAKNEKSYKYFKSLQDNGKFIKEYSAICLQSPSEITDSSSGFPPCPLYLENFIPSSENPFVIESFFRPFGPGRKLVRPVIADGKKHREVAADKGGHYRTEITGIDKNIFTIRLRRGFRHQIRCHLSWIGFPVLNDPLYPIPLTVPESNELALRSHALFFTDPSGRVCEYRIKPLEIV